MTSLSIVIPMQGNAARLEQGLVSVLENRPADCEVIVVLDGAYEDPYLLEDEVRFVDAPDGASWVDSINLGVQRARAEIVHLLGCGSQVCEGWSDVIGPHFERSEVASVAPLVAWAKGPAAVAGVRMPPGGRRVVQGPMRAYAGGGRPCPDRAGWRLLSPFGLSRSEGCRRPGDECRISTALRLALCGYQPFERARWRHASRRSASRWT